METFRLKNIAILILLLLNAGLLLLIGSQRWQSRRVENYTVKQLSALYEASQLTLDSHLQTAQQALSPLTLSRHTETEQAIASYLLGGSAASSSQGGGIYSYETASGAIQFRSGGSFDGSRLSLAVGNITDFSQQFCAQFGYTNLQIDVKNCSGSVSAVQEVAGVLIYGCNITIYFEDGVLTSVTGAHVNIEDAAVENADRINCITALVRFLDYRNAAGIICSEVTDIQCIYELQTTTTTVRLLPAWRISTDTYSYFVDCLTGEISRR
ncbi:MAG: hypothetical protein K2O18_16155 [Oscillospiraceae bacterium]|nr:hypothetical protein [Oscillospiraceae bacterium]